MADLEPLRRSALSTSSCKLDDPEVEKDFYEWISKPEIAISVAAIKALTRVIERAQCSTAMELELQLRDAADQLRRVDVGSRVAVSIDAGTELFMRYVKRCAEDFRDFEELKKQLQKRGDEVVDKSLKSRARIAQLGQSFIRDGATVLVHGYSRVVLSLLSRTANSNKNFSVICTEGRPDGSGCLLVQKLRCEAPNVPVRLVADTAVAHLMEQVDLVLVGAEAVVESGGVINAAGTYQVSLVAKATGVPVYVAAESHKFARLCPLNQRDLAPHACLTRSFQPVGTDVEFFSPTVAKARQEGGADSPPPAPAGEVKSLAEMGVETKTPMTDYTPSEYITLLFTDLGVLTPSAVSDELIALYQL